MAVAAQTRPRPGGGRLFIIFGAVLAVAAFGLVFVVGGVTGAGGSAGLTSPVVVASRDIPLRTQLIKDDILVQNMAPRDVPPGAYTKVDDVVKGNLIAEINVSKGQALTQNMLARSGEIIAGAQPAFLPIPQGFVAITIPTGEQQGVAGYIQPGDYISVIATANSGLFANSGNSRTVSITVFNNVHVLRLGASTGSVQPAGGGAAQQGQAQAGVPTSLTVVMTQCDAQYLNWLMNNAQLKYTLPSYKDYQPQDNKVDQSCPSATAAKPIGPGQVDQRWGFTKA